VGHVAQGKREMHTGFWWGKVKEIDHLGDLGVDGRTLLLILKEWDEMAWIGLIWLRTGPRRGCCEHGNEPSSSVRSEHFLGQLMIYQLLKQDSGPSRFIIRRPSYKAHGCSSEYSCHELSLKVNPSAVFSAPNRPPPPNVSTHYSPPLATPPVLSQH
jgi:hypothetical protein